MTRCLGSLAVANPISTREQQGQAQVHGGSRSERDLLTHASWSRFAVAGEREAWVAAIAGRSAFLLAP